MFVQFTRFAFEGFSTVFSSMLILFLLAILLFFYVQSRKRKCTRIYQETEHNRNVMAHLEKKIKSFKPSFFIPHAIIQAYKTSIHTRNQLSFEEEEITLEDGGKSTIDWFPLNHKEMEPSTPIVIFILGIFGTTKARYTQNLVKLIKKKGWKLAIINRRGFGFSKLKSKVFVPKDEHFDLDYAITLLSKRFPKTNLYLMGVSSGANYSARYLGEVGKNTAIKAYVSISNPFNLCRISFQMNQSWYYSFFSKLLAKGMHKVYRRQLRNEFFKERLKELGFDSNSFYEELLTKNTCWEVDEFITHKLGNHKDIYEYYDSISSEHHLNKIKTPSLFINNEEDPICQSKIIPIEKIFLNKHLKLLLTQRGGHVGFNSGWRMRYWAFETALDYFSYYQKPVN